jgi:hypothetical protein
MDKNLKLIRNFLLKIFKKLRIKLISSNIIYIIGACFLDFSFIYLFIIFFFPESVNELFSE